MRLRQQIHDLLATQATYQLWFVSFVRDYKLNSIYVDNENDENIVIKMTSILLLPFTFFSLFLIIF